ncbi:hypothetical protein OESDEN_05469 [Oesophagostomum dentatum]|uniref:UV-stimulated scaffold protein A C-terminal domain-containing protein n=1 Tax=Oesophagostomum dentatum TaxID=61180 RepID=A0A0B1TES3_OESDE|nr:hypothetical protein OESDEN_05469 [Oesophagostomum dentatum]
MLEDVSRLLRLSTARLVNEAVNAANNAVSTDSQEFKKLKNLVRHNEDAIPYYVEYLFSLLKSSNCEQRNALLSLFDYFFHRSHAFRLKTVDNLQISGIKTIKKWFEKFGAGYEKLYLVGDFLKESKAVDFESASAELLAERTRKATEEQRAAEKLQKAVDFESASAELLAERTRKATEEQRAAEKLQKIAANVRRKFDDAKADIERCVAVAEAALSILVPVFGVDDEDSNIVPKDDSIGNHSPDNELEVQHNSHGYSASETISVVLTSLTPEVTVNKDNEAVIETIRDAKVMLDVYKKNLTGWQLKIVGASGIEDLIRDMTNLKRKVEQQCEKIDELKLKPKKRKRSGNDSDSEESDLEDVPEKQLEDFVPPEELPRHILDRVRELEKEEEPCCSKSLEPNKSMPSPDDSKNNSAKSEDPEPKPRIPIVSFDLDLKYWGEKHKEPVVVRNNADSHRFWRPPDDDDKPLVSEKEAAFSEMRVITWIGEPRRAERRCKARLPSGKLCPRMDFHKYVTSAINYEGILLYANFILIKLNQQVKRCLRTSLLNTNYSRCPIHGVIVDRDDEGFPVEEVDTPRETAAQKEREQREEDEYMRDLEAGTGRSFTKKTRRKKKRPEETVRERLEGAH